MELLKNTQYYSYFFSQGKEQKFTNNRKLFAVVSSKPVSVCDTTVLNLLHYVLTDDCDL